MKLTTEWSRSLRGIAVVVLSVCAVVWTDEAANAGLFSLTPGGLGTPGSTHAMAVAPAGALAATESPYIQLTASPYTVQTGGPTLTSTVEVGDTQNPYYNAVTSPNVLTFIFQLTNPSTTSGIGYLSVNGFTGFSVSYGTWTTSGGLTPTPIVQMTSAPPNDVIDLPYSPVTFIAANNITPKVSAEVVLYTNATTYGPVLDPITWGNSAIYSAPSYMPTPEPSSLILASIGIISLLALGRRRAGAGVSATVSKLSGHPRRWHFCARVPWPVR